MSTIETKPIQVIWPIALVLVTAAITWGTVRAESEQTARSVADNRVDIRSVTAKTADLDKNVALNEQSLTQIRQSVVEINEDTKTILTMLTSQSAE
jgi:hypothetical protein